MYIIWNSPYSSQMILPHSHWTVVLKGLQYHNLSRYAYIISRSFQPLENEWVWFLIALLRLVGKWRLPWQSRVNQIAVAWALPKEKETAACTKSKSHCWPQVFQVFLMWLHTSLLMFLSSKSFTGMVRKGLGTPSEGGKKIRHHPQCLCSHLWDGRRLMVQHTNRLQEPGGSKQKDVEEKNGSEQMKEMGRITRILASGARGKYEEKGLALKATQHLVQGKEPQRCLHSPLCCLVPLFDWTQTWALCSSDSPAQC